MKKFVGMITWVLVFLTIASLICTLLTTYQFIYINHFDNYNTFQRCLVATMFMGCVSMFDKKYKVQSILYSLGCGIIAAGTMFFMYMRVI